MKKKLIIIVLTVCLLVTLVPNTVMAATNSYKDIPEGNWSISVVNSAKEYGLMEGIGNGDFGFGTSITKAQFITVLDRMFGWELINPSTSTFTDIANNRWFYPYIETALKHDVIDNDKAFLPNDPITREEMAIMLVRALGYKALAQTVSAYGQPFTDVIENSGYITIASDIGMTNGISPTTYAPKQSAKREEAAAMLVRVYERYIAKIEWSHGFYAISSYSQKDLTKDMDAVSVGWSRMSYSADKGVYLNTTSSEGNEWNIPNSYEDITSIFKEDSTKTHLNVFMDTSTALAKTDGSSANICAEILQNPDNRTQAVNCIISELTKNYSAIGYNPYSGVTIDFEGMKGNDLKIGFNLFLAELSAALKPLGKTLYVAVHPVTADKMYYDAYDYRIIGQKEGAEMGYSDVYRNPFLHYNTEDGTEMFLWYEDERSVNDKLQLAKLFGINGVSLWRFGNIPNYTDDGLYYNVWESILEYR